MDTLTTTPSERKCQECFPPEDPETVRGASVFLAGSIEMGKAIDWQSSLTSQLADLAVTIFNPRRTYWNPDWPQDIDFEPFRRQVEWEMKYLEQCDVIALYLQPGTLSPISLLELGMHAASGKVVVCCKEGFWRRGNVQVVCRRYDIPLVETMEELQAEVRTRLVKILEERKTTATG